MRRAAGTTAVRLEVREFSRNQTLVDALLKAVAAMRANKKARNVSSWTYWHYSHWMPGDVAPPVDMAAVWNQCPHRKPYFYAWHRGFLVYFEKMLQTVSGDPNLTLPYWDYHANPEMPPLFASPTLNGAPNPLYLEGRENTLVSDLEYDAFGSNVITFPRTGRTPDDSFEHLAEGNPHNVVHGTIGGAMGDVGTAPSDPVFWTHHCNVDRLWSAWLHAGGHRAMPPAGDPYYKKKFRYNLSGSWSVSVADMADSKQLGYTYSNLALPVAPADGTLPPEPQMRAPGVVVRAAEHAVEAIGPVHLGAKPFAIDVPIDEARTSVTSALLLEDLALTRAGKRGGYSIAVYANLPKTPVSEREERFFFLGNITSFDFSTAAMMQRMDGMSAAAGTSYTFPLGEILDRQRRHGLHPGNTVSIAFVPFGKPPADIGDFARLRIRY